VYALSGAQPLSVKVEMSLSCQLRVDLDIGGMGSALLTLY